MKKVIIKFVFLLCGLILSLQFCAAKRVKGYIITENADTIFGEIKIPSFSRITGAWFLNGIDLESCHFEVFFRENKKGHFRVFNPENILGFGFNYSFKDYTYHRFNIESKSIFKNERNRYRFLYLEHKGRIDLYKNVYRVNYDNSIYPSKNISFVSFDYYLFSDSIGLKKIELTSIKSLAGLLDIYGFNNNYLEQIPENTDPADIKMILEDYESWCAKEVLTKE